MITQLAETGPQRFPVDGFALRVEVFYPDPMRDDDVVAILCPYLTASGAFLRPEEKHQSMYRLLKGSTVRHGAGHVLLLTPSWLWSAFLRRSTELATGAHVPPKRPRKARRHA